MEPLTLRRLAQSPLLQRELGWARRRGRFGVPPLVAVLTVFAVAVVAPVAWIAFTAERQATGTLLGLRALAVGAATFAGLYAAWVAPRSDTALGGREMREQLRASPIPEREVAVAFVCGRAGWLIVALLCVAVAYWTIYLEVQHPAFRRGLPAKHHYLRFTELQLLAHVALVALCMMHAFLSAVLTPATRGNAQVLAAGAYLGWAVVGVGFATLLEAAGKALAPTIVPSERMKLFVAIVTPPGLLAVALAGRIASALERAESYLAEESEARDTP